MPVTTLHLEQVGPIANITVACDPNINVFIGPNNCGKTTVLLALADILINPFTFPGKLLREGAKFRMEFEPDRALGAQPDLNLPLPPAAVSGPLPIEVVEGSSWNPVKLNEMAKQMGTLGFRCYIPALRLNTDFRSAGPTASKEATGSPNDFELLPSGRIRPRPNEEENPSDFLKDYQIVQEVIALDYDAYRKREAGAGAREVLDTIFKLVSQITEGFPIEFAGVGADKTGFYLEFKTPDGKVPFNVLSQGTQALIQWVVRLVVGMARRFKFPKKLRDKPGILILDEMDAHLHPAWQRNILPVLAKSFPKLQLFCSAHSPMVLAGLRRGQIHLMSRQPDGSIKTTTNEEDISGWSADEILTRFYGLFAATDHDTDASLQRLDELRSRQKRTVAEEKELERLRTRVSRRMAKGPISPMLSEIAALMNRAASVGTPPQAKFKPRPGKATALPK